MPNPENLIGKGIKKGDTIIPSMGGKVRSKKKKNSQKMRWLKHKISREGNLSNKDEQWLIARLNDPEVMDLDMLSWLDQLRKASPDEHFDGKLLTLYTQLKKSIHPERKVLDVNVKTLDLNKPLDESTLKLLMEDFE